MNFGVRLQNSLEKFLKYHTEPHLTTEFCWNLSNKRDSVGNTYSPGQFKIFENITFFVDDIFCLAHIIKIY